MNSSSRKNQLKALFGAGPLDIKPTEQTPPPPSPVKIEQNSASSASELHHTIPPAQLTAAAVSEDLQPVRHAAGRSGAVKAMGLSLADMSRELETAKQLSENLAKAEQVIELDPALIDGSFVEDRLTAQEKDDPAFLALVQSLYEHGQQVPILVRPHPQINGRFQAAYGHRRMRAAARLGKHVKALVRGLTDTQLVLAQGKENSERRDLSFIERALFARSLIERGFERSVVQDALSLHKAEMTRFLQVASSVPETIIRAIGPAPKVGRPRWMQLAEHLKDRNLIKQALRFVERENFRDAESDMRFHLLLQNLVTINKPEASVVKELLLHSHQGVVLGAVKLKEGRAHLEFNHQQAEDFAAFLTDQMADLFAAFQSNIVTRLKPNEEGRD